MEMEEKKEFNEGVTEKVDSVDASKILTNSEAAAKTSSAAKQGTETTADSYATLSMVFGLLSIVGGFSGLISLGFGIVGLIMASNAKKLGYDDVIRKVGFWTSLIGVIVSGCAFLACVAVILFVGLGTVLSIVGTILAVIAGGALAASNLIILV